MDAYFRCSVSPYCIRFLRRICAVVYLLDPKSTATSSSLILLTSKTKVADLKFQSTARLELNGTLLLSDLLKWTVQLYKPRRVEVKAFKVFKVIRLNGRHTLQIGQVKFLNGWSHHSGITLTPNSIQLIALQEECFLKISWNILFG